MDQTQISIDYNEKMKSELNKIAERTLAPWLKAVEKSVRESTQDRIDNPEKYASIESHEIDPKKPDFKTRLDEIYKTMAEGKSDEFVQGFKLTIPVLLKAVEQRNNMHTFFCSCDENEGYDDELIEFMKGLK